MPSRITVRHVDLVSPTRRALARRPATGLVKHAVLCRPTEAFPEACKIDPKNPLYRRLATVRRQFGNEGFGTMLRNLLCLNAVLYPEQEVPHDYFLSFYGPEFSPADKSLVPTGIYTVQFHEYLIPYRSFLIDTLFGATPEEGVERTIQGMHYSRLLPIYKVYASERSARGSREAINSCLEHILTGAGNRANVTSEQAKQMTATWDLMHQYPELFCLLEDLPLLWVAHRLVYSMDAAALGLHLHRLQTWRVYASNVMHDVERSSLCFLRGEIPHGDYQEQNRSLMLRAAKMLRHLGHWLEVAS